MRVWGTARGDRGPTGDQGARLPELGKVTKSGKPESRNPFPTPKPRGRGESPSSPGRPGRNGPEAAKGGEPDAGEVPPGDGGGGLPAGRWTGKAAGGAERGKGAPGAVGERTRGREGKARTCGEKRRCAGGGLVGKERTRGVIHRARSVLESQRPRSLLRCGRPEWGPALAPPVRARAAASDDEMPGKPRSAPGASCAGFPARPPGGEGEKFASLALCAAWRGVWAAAAPGGGSPCLVGREDPGARKGRPAPGTGAKPGPGNVVRELAWV